MSEVNRTGSLQVNQNVKQTRHYPRVLVHKVGEESLPVEVFLTRKERWEKQSPRYVIPSHPLATKKQEHSTARSTTPLSVPPDGREKNDTGRKKRSSQL